MKQLFSRMLNRTPTWRYAGRTDVGRVRSRNEDAFLIMEGRNVLVVADGMGGHQGGDVASRMAVEHLTSYYRRGSRRKWAGNPWQVRDHLTQAVHGANEAIMEAAREDTDLTDMGCTLAIGLVTGNELHTCHVGDVRCYVAGPERIVQVTKDHSLVAGREEGDAKSPSASQHVALRHVVTRALGFPMNEDPTCERISLDGETRVLLCSDGLWSLVEDREIHRILTDASTPEGACEGLVARAIQLGGGDNVTAVVAFRG